MEMDDNDLEYPRLSSLSPPSPISTPLSLPSADINDDLLPAHLGSPSFIPYDADPIPAMPLNNRSLLLLNDPDDVLLSIAGELPSRPLALKNRTDPEVCRLYNICKKLRAAECSARLVEVRMLEGVSVQMRWEALVTEMGEGVDGARGGNG